MIEFTAAGSPADLARAIEDHARSQASSVTAIVVPWESSPTALSMAVTAVKSDGWAIEHTNLGTIRLTDLGNGQTRVALGADEPDHPEKQKLAAIFDRFARQLESRFHTAV